MAGSAPRPKKPSVKNPETGAYPGCAASSCKSLQPQISRKSAEIPPTFQRAFLDRECASSNPPRSANQCCASSSSSLRSADSDVGNGRSSLNFIWLDDRHADGVGAESLAFRASAHFDLSFDNRLNQCPKFFFRQIGRHLNFRVNHSSPCMYANLN